jgi:hypothetical protein
MTIISSCLCGHFLSATGAIAYGRSGSCKPGVQQHTVQQGLCSRHCWLLLLLLLAVALLLVVLTRWLTESGTAQMRVNRSM